MSDELSNNNIIDIESAIDGDSGLTVNVKVKDMLLKTAKWSTFLSILGFIGIGFMVIAALYMLSMTGNSMGYLTEQFMIMGGAYLVIAVIYFFPIYFLFKFSSKMKEGIQAASQLSFEEGIEYLYKHYRFVGIFTIIIISLYLLAILFAASFYRF